MLTEAGPALDELTGETGELLLAVDELTGEAGALLTEAGPALDELSGEAGALLTEAGPALDELSGEAGALLTETGAAGLLDAGVDEAGAGVGQRVIVLGMAVIKGF